MDKQATRKKPLALVVDDDFSLRLSMRAALIKADFDVLEAESGPQALDLFQSDRPNLILLDVIMPEMDGFETCTKIRKMPGGNDVQILMVTGLDDVESIELAFEAGANDFVSKPLNWLLLGYKAKYMLRAGRAFHDLNQSKKRLQKTQEIARIGNWEIILSSNEFHCSPDACRLLGYTQCDAGMSLKDFLAPVVDEDHGQVEKKFDYAFNHRQPFSLHYRIQLDDKKERHILNQAEIIYNESDQPEIMMGVIQDVTKMKLAEEEIRQLAFYDSLTGLANRWLFQNRLEHEASKAKRQNETFAMLFLDLDHFKRINDSYGHTVGDILLQNSAKILQECIRNSDTICRQKEEELETNISRFGGDEFIILLSNIKSPESAAVIARRIIKEMPVVHNIKGNLISITTSIGISVYPTDGTEPEILLKNADYAMYQAKEAGRNIFKFYDKSLNKAAIERFSLENDLVKAMEREEFLVFYQPILDLASRKIVGAEALIRWLHPHKGMIQPGSFIPLAEDSGLIIKINKWLIETICRQNNEWAKAGVGPVRISFNLSGYQLEVQNLIKTIKENLEKYSIEPKNLVVEITESVLLQDSQDTISILQDIKDLPLKIALDDFGTGYSSLSYLAAFNADTIKIDRSFIMGCTLNESNLVIIKAIIAMGKSLDMNVIAEGIETEEQLELLNSLGVQEGQGFYFKPPVSHDEFGALLKKGAL
jgi:diguanylate cyclase (GGDEF)-like protein/PAS domain S-box-containing protein